MVGSKLTRQDPPNVSRASRLYTSTLQNTMGETRVGAVVRQLREARGLTLRAVAGAGWFLGQLPVPSRERAGFSLDQFNGTNRGCAGCDSGRVFSDCGAGIESLAGGELNRTLQPILVTIKPEGSSGKRPYPAPSEEFALVLTGSVVLTTDEQEQVLSEGDAVTSPKGGLRRWQNLGTEPTQIVIVAAR
jgi:quercetin dioxygenase-like cupin family protein